MSHHHTWLFCYSFLHKSEGKHGGAKRCVPPHHRHIFCISALFQVHQSSFISSSSSGRAHEKNACSLRVLSFSPLHPNMLPSSCVEAGKHPAGGSMLTKTQLLWVCMWAEAPALFRVFVLVGLPSSGPDGCCVHLDFAIEPIIATWKRVAHLLCRRDLYFMHREPVLLKCFTNKGSALLQRHVWFILFVVSWANGVRISR